MSEFEYHLDAIIEAHKGLLRSFGEFISKKWKHETKEQWKSADPYPGDEYVKGWNEAITSMDGAIDCFLEEYNS